jgi:hypothetical protein
MTINHQFSNVAPRDCDDSAPTELSAPYGTGWAMASRTSVHVGLRADARHERTRANLSLNLCYFGN